MRLSYFELRRQSGRWGRSVAHLNFLLLAACHPSRASVADWPCDRNRPFTRWALLLVLVSLNFPLGCGRKAVPMSERTLAVRTQVVSIVSQPRLASLTGEFRARYQSDLAFRIGGRIASREVDVGDHVEVGDVMAMLDTQVQMADIASAKAMLRSAEASFQQASSIVKRVERLLATQAASQEEFDEAKAAFLTAQGSVEIGKAAILAAEEQLTYTEIKAKTAGSVVARLAEAGQVVNAAQTVFTLAYDGEREAVFDAFQTHVSERPVDDQVDIALVSNPSIKTLGIVREIAPSIDPINGTVRVKVAIEAPPPQMTLGAPVIGVAKFQSTDVAVLPWTALSRQGDRAAVWVVDPVKGTASERTVTIDRYSSGKFLVSSGLTAGDVVVTEGVQLLRPGQKVIPTAGANP